jgi:TRAP-type C4-dicarboxylate transport system substrate-binding protein
MAEMLTAVQTKVVDGLITNENTLGQMPGITKMLPYILDVRFYPAPIWFAVSTKWWNTVPADVQQQLQAVINDGGTMCAELYDKQFEQAWATVRADPNVTVTKLSDADLAKLRQLVKPAWDVVAKEIGDQGWPMINAAEKYR